MKLFVDGERTLESKLEEKVYQTLIEIFESYDELTIYVDECNEFTVLFINIYYNIKRLFLGKNLSLVLLVSSNELLFYDSMQFARYNIEFDDVLVPPVKDTMWKRKQVKKWAVKESDILFIYHYWFSYVNIEKLLKISGGVIGKQLINVADQLLAEKIIREMNIPAVDRYILEACNSGKPLKDVGEKIGFSSTRVKQNYDRVTHKISKYMYQRLKTQEG